MKKPLAARCGVENRLEMLTYSRVRCAFEPVFALHRIHQRLFHRPAKLLAGLLGAGLLVFGLSQAHAQQGPGLGVEVKPKDYAAWDISIQPDGEGLPAGSGDAATGATIYAAKCAACHGPKGAGKPNEQLVGGQGTLTQLNQVRTVGSYWPYATTVFDYIRRAMPFQAPESLTDNEAYALTAYLLALNGIIDDDEVMNARSLPKVEMPNRDGFIFAYPPKPDR